MRRQLISHDAFNEIEKNSLSSAASELTQIEPILGDLLELEDVRVHCYNENNVYFEAQTGNFIRADYQLNEHAVDLDNIEEIVIDEKSQNKARRVVISDMLEAVLKEESARASDLFRNYLEISVPKMKYTKSECDKTAVQKRKSNVKSNMIQAEAYEVVRRKKKAGGADPWKVKAGEARGERGRQEAIEEKKRTRPIWEREHEKTEFKRGKTELARKRRSAGSEDEAKQLRLKEKRIGAGKKGNKFGDKKEWTLIGSQVLEYIDHVTSGPALAEVSVERDDMDNIVAAHIPTSRVRNEGKLLALKWDTLKTDVKVLRKQAMRLGFDESFQRLVTAIKRLNNLSDNDQLEETLNSLVGTFPSVLYLTQDEMAQIIGEALANNGATNYDDEICHFIAEGILRVAFDSYPERVNRLASLSSAPPIRENEDPYIVFQTAMYDFFPVIDDQMRLEMRVFEDLYDTFVDVRSTALEEDDNLVRKQASNYLAQIEEVLNGSVRPNLGLVEELGVYLTDLVETNLEMKPWAIAKRPYRTVAGEHPEMAKKAQHPYAPSRDFSGDWGGKLPVSDGASYRSGGEKEMRNRSWGNEDGPSTYPSLNNPYILKSGDWTMTADKGVDKTSNDATGQWGSGDTWPDLTNPYIPQSVKKHVSDANRVDDVESRVGLSRTSDLNQKIS